MLYFIGYDIDETLPWHSTLSRTRQLYGETLYKQLFKQVLKECLDKGMVSGRKQAMDSVAVKANAEEIPADAGYSSGEALQALEDNNIEGYIPNFGQYKASREGFIYNKENDRYTCSRGVHLPFKKQIVTSLGYQMKVYRSSAKGLWPLSAQECMHRQE